MFGKHENVSRSSCIYVACSQTEWQQKTEPENEVLFQYIQTAGTKLIPTTGRIKAGLTEKAILKKLPMIVSWGVLHIKNPTEKSVGHCLL